MPKFYDVVADSLALKRARVHHTRVIRIDGQDLPYWQRTAENLWGQSVLERLFDRLIAFDTSKMRTPRGTGPTTQRSYGRVGPSPTMKPTRDASRPLCLFTRRLINTISTHPSCNDGAIG